MSSPTCISSALDDVKTISALAWALLKAWMELQRHQCHNTGFGRFDLKIRVWLGKSLVFDLAIALLLMFSNTPPYQMLNEQDQQK